MGGSARSTPFPLTQCNERAERGATMRTTTLRLTTLAGSVLLWFAIPSFSQTNRAVSFSKHATVIRASGSWTANAIAAIALINNSSKPADKDTLFADDHFQNSNNDLRNSQDDYGKPKDDHKKWVSPEGGASVDYLLVAGIACCAAIYLRRKQWAGRDLADFSD